MLNKKVIVRGDRSGVFFGTLAKVGGRGLDQANGQMAVGLPDGSADTTENGGIA